MKRAIAVLTTGRQDYGILRSTCRALRRSEALDLQLVVAGMHLDERFGRSVSDIELDGLPIAARLATMRPTPTEEAAETIAQLGGWLDSTRPAALLLVGDRAETAAAAIAATLARVPLVHLHGGEETEGAIDNALRHALTKLAALHFVAHPIYAQRIRQMGEPDDAVHVVGAPGLDNLVAARVISREELASSLGIALEDPVVVVTHHPATLGADPTEEVNALVAAMERVPATYVITLPNNDSGADVIRDRLCAFADGRRRAVTVAALGSDRYPSLLRIAAAMLGNSSSGIIEAPFFGLPVVNVGDRQRGRLRGSNVLDVEPRADAIVEALQTALSPQLRERAASEREVFGDGHAGARIVRVLERWQPGDTRKRFVDR
jgi:UDP-hydrolysing UDP-N-acetyl-D-glucosamine 2-epimerase